MSISLSAIQEAIDSGHKASDMLYEVLEYVAETFTCPEADGFEGPDTFAPCRFDDCLFCVAKKIVT